MYDGVGYKEREGLRNERLLTGLSYKGQQEINKRLSEVAEERTAKPEYEPSEARIAAAAGRLLREILQPDEQHRLATSLTTGPRISPQEDAILLQASELIRALPGEYWNNALSLLAGQRVERP